MKRLLFAFIPVLVIAVIASLAGCKAPAKFEVTSIDIAPKAVVVGEVATVIAQVKNTGDSQGTYTVTLSVDGQEPQTQDVTVAAGATKVVTFTVIKGSAGAYAVKVNGLSDTLRVLKPAKFTVTDLTLTPVIAEVGQMVAVAVNVSNIGEIEGSYAVILTIDGVEVERKNVIVAPGITERVTFFVTKDKAGNYQVAVGEIGLNLVVKEKESVFLAKINTIPDYTQTDLAYGGLPGGGTQYCGPVSVSNSLMWLSDNGFPKLTPYSGDRKRDQFQVAYILGSSDYMNTSLKDGTSPNGLCKGLKKYILEKGYAYKRLELQGWRYIEPEFSTGKDVPDLEWVKLGIRGYSSAWLNIGWYTYNSATEEYTRIGGHWVTLVGYGHDGSSPKPDYLIVHDPSPQAGTTFRNEYILPVRITTGTLKGSYAGLPRSAIGFYKITGIPISPRADLGILDAVVVLEMQP